MNLAIFIMSDPEAGEDALGRLFNGLALAAEAKAQGDKVDIVFAGAGTRWPKALAGPDHPAHGLYESVRDVVTGISCGCAESFDAADSAESCGLPMLDDFALDGTNGLASFRRYMVTDYKTLTF